MATKTTSTTNNNAGCSPCTPEAHQRAAMKRITITISEATEAALVDLAKACGEADKTRNGATTHGPLTPAQLLAMLAEDAGMVITRPGSWEAANLHQVLISHGYDV